MKRQGGEFMIDIAKEVTFRLSYCEETDRWEAYNLDGDFCYDLHCGALLALQIDDYFYACRLEFDNAWYVIFKNAKLHLRPNSTYLSFLG
jgi:hypothetical protein